MNPSPFAYVGACGTCPERSRRIVPRLSQRPTRPRHSERSRPIFFFPIRSCESVGLRREESLFAFHRRAATAAGVQIL
jgi:hypothetical protein